LVTEIFVKSVNGTEKFATEFRTVFPCPKNTYLDPETSFKFTDKYQRLRQLVWRPFTKRKKYRYEREIKTEISFSFVWFSFLLTSVSEAFKCCNDTFILLSLFCLLGKDRSPASSGTGTTQYSE